MDKSNNVTFNQLIPFQDWAYVEVVRDFHKHLGDEDTACKLAVLNEVIKPYRKAKGNERAALQFLTLAVYMGGILTPDCMHALDLVRNHKLNKQVKDKDTRPQATKEEIMEAWTELVGADEQPKSETKKALEETGHVDSKTTDKEEAKHSDDSIASASQTVKSSQAQKASQSIRDEVGIAIFGSAEKAREVRNDFFGYDFDAAFNMSFEDMRAYIDKCHKVGWRNVKI